MSFTRCIMWALAILLAPTGTSLASGMVAEVDLHSVATSNIFLDKSAEWDLALKPAAELGYDFGRFWSIGYNGQLAAYTRHDELLSHWHELYLFANPAWGQDAQNELVVEATVETLRNQEDYQALNMIQPQVLVKLIMEPVSWFRWRVAARGVYRWYYDDQKSSSFDAWADARVTFTLPSRTTLTPRLAFGHRRYTGGSGGPGGGRSGAADLQDQQMEAGVHLSQALWKGAGLRLDYAYLLALDDSGILERKLTDAQFAYLGEVFLYSGHRAVAGLKQMFGESAVAGVDVRLIERDFAGWPAVDAQGMLRDEDRRDLRFGPRVYFGYAWWPRNKSSSCVPSVNVDVAYQYLRQRSNSDWYDTSAHLVSLAVWGTW